MNKQLYTVSCKSIKTLKTHNIIAIQNSESDSEILGWFKLYMDIPVVTYSELYSRFK